MNRFNGINHCGHSCRHVHHLGFAGILVGTINLATTALYGGARVIRRVIENAAWQGVSDCYPQSHNKPGCYSQPDRHCYCIECVPTTYTSCCR